MTLRQEQPIVPSVFDQSTAGFHQSLLQAGQRLVVDSAGQRQAPPLNPDVLCQNVLYPILDRLGISRRSGASGFHTFRHSAASILNERTGNLKLAQRLLGHSTVDMTANVYTHTPAESEREAALAIELAI
ncbi:MAG: tyrosine-type recombinase/integrase [Acidobacteriia bacterium]|nr:tyrosine-type recombinase/integrase [Terriglobia bacterium]